MGLPLKRNVRFYVLVFSVLLAVVVWLQTFSTVSDSMLRVTSLTRYYGLLAFVYLYLALLIGPVVYTFHSLPWRGHIYRARRAIGFSAFLFAQLHAEIAFWLQLGGIKGLSSLPTNYLIAITLSSMALTILTLMAATSFDKAVQYLGIKRWKLLHRFIYLAGLLVLIHALLIGTDFADLNASLPRIFSLAVGFLLILEANRFDAYLARVFVWPKKIPIFLSLWIVVVVVYIWNFFVRQ